jgi:hypothetical protein
MPHGSSVLIAQLRDTPIPRRGAIGPTNRGTTILRYVYRTPIFPLRRGVRLSFDSSPSISPRIDVRGQ